VTSMATVSGCASPAGTAGIDRCERDRKTHRCVAARLPAANTLLPSATSSYATDSTGSKSSCGSGARARRSGGLEASPRLSRILVIADSSVTLDCRRLDVRLEVERRERGELAGEHARSRGAGCGLGARLRGARQPEATHRDRIINRRLRFFSIGEI
jgi:hypothetical protein